MPPEPPAAQPSAAQPSAAQPSAAQPSAAQPPAFDAVILAGGQARRLGGADKPALTVGGVPLAAAVARAAVTAGARRVILVGPPRPALAAELPAPPGGLHTVREDPPGGGPVPALRAGLALVTAPLVAVLAADLPFLRAPHLHVLLRATARNGAGAVLEDDQGRAQWLAGAWVTAPLRAALGAYQGRALHPLLAPLAPALLTGQPAPGDPPPWLDCDTPADLAAAQAWMATSRLAPVDNEHDQSAERDYPANRPANREASS
jgi:molybdenum cofactor guanylyltransferase